MKSLLFLLQLSGCAQVNQVFVVADTCTTKQHQYVKFAMTSINEHFGCDVVVFGSIPAKELGAASVIFVPNLSELRRDPPNFVAAADTDPYSQQIRVSTFTVDDVQNFYNPSDNDLLDLGVLVHELGHAFGLEHSKSDDDIMSPFENLAIKDPEAWGRYIHQLKEHGVSCLK